MILGSKYAPGIKLAMCMQLIMMRRGILCGLPACLCVVGSVIKYQKLPNLPKLPVSENCLFVLVNQPIYTALYIKSCPNTHSLLSIKP